jgi:hypothetical protein
MWRPRDHLRRGFHAADGRPDRHDGPVAADFLDARRIQGVAPALPAGRYNVKVSEVSALGPTISHTLEGGLTYAKLATLPGPQQIETSLAEGTARFSWFNPIPYDQILVLDANDKPIRTLSGERAVSSSSTQPASTSWRSSCAA